MHTTRRTLLASSTLLLANAAFAQTPPTTPWPEVTEHLPGGTLAGQARLRYWGFEVYEAQLWTPPSFRASQYAQHPLALSLTYLRTLRGKAIAERSLEEMRLQGPITTAQASTWLAQMQASFPDVRAQDRLTGLHQPGVGARFWFNGKPQATVADDAFSQRFFGIWLSESTSQPEMRRALLARTAA